MVNDVILQTLDVSKGADGLTGKIDDPNVEFAAEQFAAYVDSADETFVPVRFVGPTAWDGFYRVTDVQASASPSKLLGLSVSLERVRGFAAPIFWDEFVFCQLLFHMVWISTWLINLINGNDDWYIC